MAGDWIKVEHATVDKPEVIRLADLMGFRHPDQAVGLLIRFWVWLDRNLRNDSVTLLYAKTIDAVTHENGFCGALCAIGWAEMDESTGIVTIKNVERHNGTPAKTRALGKDRSATQRQRERNANIVTREDKNRLDIKPKTKTPASRGLPEGFAISEAVKSWAAEKGHAHLQEHFDYFIGYAKANGKKYADWDQALQNCIRGNWAGVGTSKSAVSGATAAWWTSEPATLAKGKELGIAPRGGESMSDYRGRISEAVQARATA